MVGRQNSWQAGQHRAAAGKHIYRSQAIKAILSWDGRQERRERSCSPDALPAADRLAALSHRRSPLPLFSGLGTMSEVKYHLLESVKRGTRVKILFMIGWVTARIAARVGPCSEQ